MAAGWRVLALRAMRDDTHNRPRGMESDRTRRAVGMQLAAMGCERYELGVRDGETGAMIPLVASPDGVMKSVGWLKHRNSAGCDVYVRPHGSVGLVLVDDVTPAALKELYADGLSPAAVVMTSPDNYQAWVRISASPIASDLATATARELARRYGGDLAAATWRHYGRLAGFTNRKPAYRGADGRYPFVLFMVGRLGVAPAGATLLAVVAQEADKTAQRADLASVNLCAHGCDLVAEYRQAVEWHRERFGVDDYSRLDWMIVRELAIAHPEASAADLARALRAGSPDVERRKLGHVADYAARTVGKVLEALRS